MNNVNAREYIEAALDAAFKRDDTMGKGPYPGVTLRYWDIGVPRLKVGTFYNKGTKRQSDELGLFFAVEDRPGVWFRAGDKETNPDSVSAQKQTGAMELRTSLDGVEELINFSRNIISVYQHA